MTNTCTILPLKRFDHSKTRLSAVLSPLERATIARLMAIDVLRTLAAVPEIDRVLVAGRAADHAALAADFGCDFIEDDPALDVSGNVARAAGMAGSGILFYLPADLPLLTAADISRLFAQHRRGLTICRASRDNGTNAMLASPPAAASFAFGSGSAVRHAAAARRGGWPVRVVDVAGFHRDIDEPADLAWFCRHGTSGATLDYVDRAGIAARFATTPATSLAS